MSPHGVIEGLYGKQSFSISGQVAITTHEANMRHNGSDAQAHVTVTNDRAKNEIGRAIKIASGETSGKIKVTIQPDGLGVVWVNNIADATYVEKLPNFESLQISVRIPTND